MKEGDFNKMVKTWFALNGFENGDTIVRNHVKKKYPLAEPKRGVYFRMNNSAHVLEYKGKRRVIKGWCLGGADYMVLTGTRFKAVDQDSNCYSRYYQKTIFIELKATGKRQSNSQKAFEKMVARLGFEYYVVDTIEKLGEALL